MSVSPGNYLPCCYYTLVTGISLVHHLALTSGPIDPWRLRPQISGLLDNNNQQSTDLQKACVVITHPNFNEYLPHSWWLIVKLTVLLLFLYCLFFLPLFWQLSQQCCDMKNTIAKGKKGCLVMGIHWDVGLMLIMQTSLRVTMEYSRRRK